MSDLVKQVQLGDITFGTPKDIELLHTPWGFYKFLGVDVEASQEVIKKAYRGLSRIFHPDKGGDIKMFQSLGNVANVLLDEGGELGEEHSKRRHYDEVCSLDVDFDGFIKHKDDRTKKFSEFMLINLEMERKSAKNEFEITKKFPEFSDLRRKYESSTSEKKRNFGRNGKNCNKSF